MKSLAVAFDLDTREDLFLALEKFEGLDLVVKLGLGMLPKLEPDDMDEIKDQGFQIFVDAKLHDIPSQVARAVKTWNQKGADYLTVHLSGGKQMLGEALKVAGKTSLFGVSVLTSLPATKDEVKTLVTMGMESGMSAFVCSVNEVGSIKELNKNVYCVTPGIKLDDSAKSSPDQARVYTVEEAIKAGSDMLVVGRAIMQSKDPKNEAEKIIKMLRSA